MLSADNASKTLPNCCWFAGIANVMAFAMIYFSLFNKATSPDFILSLLTLTAFIGFVSGLHITYRSNLNSTTALYSLLYLLLIMGFMFAGGFVAFLPKMFGRSDMSWNAFFTFCAVISIFLLVGLYRGAKFLGWPDVDQQSIWSTTFGKLIDYPSRQIIPDKMLANTKGAGWPLSNYALIGIGMNTPLLFELYSGDRLNAVFLIIPLLTVIWGYINIYLIGPGLVKLASLRKLEKSLGYRFINADLEQIQELRRTFFLSRWLMKDYVKP